MVLTLVLHILSMPLFTKESLENLRQRIDLVDVLNAHLDLKRAGAAYKGLCPFHDEKNPSFMIQRGDTHYHCFGCGAHGDAIQFLMAHLKMSFSEAVESLAERFHVPLEVMEEADSNKGPSKTLLKEALEQACRFYHFYLLHTQEGHEVLHYLYKRGLDLDFIRHFQIGLAPKVPGHFRQVMHAKYIKDEILRTVGLIAEGKEGRWRDFFSDRITFPIRDAAGAVIGFSARKYKEQTFGGKYINTPETTLFKKSRVLFGLNYCRRRLAKEGRVIIVEGQIDALRLIQEGFNFTVAGQGTAFGEGHAKELLMLGINLVYLALDGDSAGQEASVKIGDLFQREGVEVRMAQMPKGLDPDVFLREKGPEAFLKLLETSSDYLDFLVKHYSQQYDLRSPAAKHQCIERIAKQIRQWDQPVLVQESLRKLAHLMQVPENTLLLEQIHTPNLYIKKAANIGLQTIDPDRILEMDLLRWLLMMPEERARLLKLAQENLKPSDFRVPICQKMYLALLDACQKNEFIDVISLILKIDDLESQLIISDLLEKKINKEKAEANFVETLQKILTRNWMGTCELVKMKIQSGQCTDDEVLELVKEYNTLRKSLPKVNVSL
ncbi:DNA primase|nr:DNA primase [Neochlamydia sp. AcF84]